MPRSAISKMEVHTPRKSAHKPPTRLLFSAPTIGRRARLAGATRRAPRYPHQTSKLWAVKEEESNAFHDLVRESAVDTDGEHDGMDNGSSEDSADEEEDWDEERTLVAILADHKPMKDENTALSALAEGLRPAFAHASQRSREDIVQVLLPALRRVRAAHDQLATRTNRECAAGVLGLDDVCQRFEAADTEDRALAKALPETQAKLNALFKTLKERYTQREQLQAEFQAMVKEKTDCMRERVNALPGDMERLILKLEKKSKELDKDDGGAAKARERMLQGYLKKL